MNNKRLGVEHFGYRIIALLITLILWVTVVSQREMTSDQWVNVQFVVPTGFLIQGTHQVEVRVRVEGPRPILKKFIETSWPANVVVPIRNPSAGLYPAEIPVADFAFPPEVRVISIYPREILLQIAKGTQ